MPQTSPMLWSTIVTIIMINKALLMNRANLSSKMTASESIKNINMISSSKWKF